MMMQLELQIILVLSVLSRTDGWVNTQAVAGSSQARLGYSLLWDRTEPAGVETMFRTAKNMRTSQMQRLANNAKAGSKLTWFLKGGKRRRRRRMEHNVDRGFPTTAGQAGCQEVADMVEQVSLPPVWEFKNDKELKALASMKILLLNDYLDLADSTVSLPSGQMVSVLTHFPDVYGDIRLLRFLRKDRAGDPVSASMAFRKFMGWRKDNNVDEIRAAVEIQSFAVPPELRLVSDLLPCNFDIKGGPRGAGCDVLITLLVGKWRTTALASLIRNEEMPLSDFLAYWTYMFESLHKRLDEESVKQGKMVFVDAISDLKGFSLQQISPSFLSIIVRPWIKQLQSNYSETARRIDVTHPPKVVSLLWKLIVPMLSPGTVAKIRIH